RTPIITDEAYNFVPPDTAQKLAQEEVTVGLTLAGFGSSLQRLAPAARGRRAGNVAVSRHRMHVFRRPVSGISGLSPLVSGGIRAGKSQHGCAARRYQHGRAAHQQPDDGPGSG